MGVEFLSCKKYFETNGNLDIGSKYVTDNGVAHGTWISNLRTWNNAGVHPKYLSPERKQQLDEIGMVWDKFSLLWERNFSSACRYYQVHRNLNVPARYVDEDGIRLGTWIARCRGLYRGTVKTGALTDDQIKHLESIGMVWDLHFELQWKEFYSEAKKYFEENGNLNIPGTYESDSGKKLGRWLIRQRKLFSEGKLSEEKIQTQR